MPDEGNPIWIGTPTGPDDAISVEVLRAPCHNLYCIQSQLFVTSLPCVISF